MPRIYGIGVLDWSSRVNYMGKHGRLHLSEFKESPDEHFRVRFTEVHDEVIDELNSTTELSLELTLDRKIKQKIPAIVSLSLTKEETRVTIEPDNCNEGHLSWKACSVEEANELSGLPGDFLRSLQVLLRKNSWQQADLSVLPERAEVVSIVIYIQKTQIRFPSNFIVATARKLNKILKAL